MVIPENSRFAQDRARGFVRELHRNLAVKELSYRNVPDVDYSELVNRANIIATQSEDGYVLGVPHGRHLKVYYEFDYIERLRRDFTRLVRELSEIAHERTDCTVMALEFNDFPHRHYIDAILRGSDFSEPVDFAVMRCRDVREQEIPDASSGITIREASEADADTIVALEETLSGDAGIAPPLPAEFFSDVRWIGVAEVGGALRGYIRLQDTDKRGMVAEEFQTDRSTGADVAGALLHAAFELGRANNRRALTLRVAQEVMADPLLKAYGFRHAGDGLQYMRPVDPSELERRRENKTASYFKVGKIWGKW